MRYCGEVGGGGGYGGHHDCCCSFDQMPFGHVGRRREDVDECRDICLLRALPGGRI